MKYLCKTCGYIEEIDNLSIDFNEGFNVLTGETWGRKKLSIESLAIIAGGRLPKELIRKGLSVLSM